MKKAIGIVVLGLGLIFLFKYSFSNIVKTLGIIGVVLIYEK